MIKIIEVTNKKGKEVTKSVNAETLTEGVSKFSEGKLKVVDDKKKAGE